MDFTADIKALYGKGELADSDFKELCNGASLDKLYDSLTLINNKLEDLNSPLTSDRISIIRYGNTYTDTEV